MKIHVKKIMAREFLLLISVGVLGLLTFLCIYPYNSYQQHQVYRLSEKIIEKKKLSDSLVYLFNKKTEKQTWLFNKHREYCTNYILWRTLDSLYPESGILPQTNTYEDFISKYTTNKDQIAMWNILHSKRLYTKSYSAFNEQFFAKGQDIFTSDFLTTNTLWMHLDKLSLQDSIRFKFVDSWTETLKSKLKGIGFNSAEELSNFIIQNRISPIDSSNCEKAKSIHKDISELENELKNHEQQLVSGSQQTDFGIKSLILFGIIFFAFRYLYYSIKWSINILKS
jgi:hypothetical protein